MTSFVWRLFDRLIQASRRAVRCFREGTCDWYEPVKTCLERIVPRLSRGSLVSDDYNDWLARRKASDEYFSPPSSSYRMDNRHGVMMITRVA